MCEWIYILILTQKFSSMIGVKDLESSSLFQERDKCLNAKFVVQDVLPSEEAFRLFS